MTRFVILEHTWNGVHFDVMVQAQDTLKTWSMEQMIVADQPMKARQRPDHRLIYLDYEGSVSGDRGTVRRVVGGNYRTVSWAEDRVVLQLESPQLSGELRFETEERGGDWSLLFLPGKVDCSTRRLGSDGEATARPVTDRPASRINPLST